MNKIKKKIFNILRNYVLKDITENLGKVEVTDDKIICYVNNKKIKKHKKGKYLPVYELMFKSKKIYPEETLNAYKVNKPIHYVIEGMNFDNALIIIAPYDSNITFRNCKFNDEISILSDSDIILENNKYYDLCPIYTRKSRCFFNVNARNITFINDNFINSEFGHHPTKFGIDVIANNLKIINSNFDMLKDDGEIFIRAKQLYIVDSYINCYKIMYIDSDEINTDNSLIESKTGIMIDNTNNNKILDFNSPNTIYNGVDLTNYDSITSENVDLQKSRVSLIEKLRELKNNCMNINLSELQEVQNILNQRSIVKTLKK